MKTFIKQLEKIVLSLLITLLVVTSLPVITRAEEEGNEVTKEETKEVVEETSKKEETQETFEVEENKEEEKQEQVEEISEEVKETVEQVEDKVENQEEIDEQKQETKVEEKNEEQNQPIKAPVMAKLGGFNLGKNIIITYDGNGATSGSMSTSTLNSLNVIGETLKKNDYSKTGYDFNGWNTAANGSGDAFENEKRVYYSTFDKNTTLYAQWKLHDYKITYENVDGASFTASNPTSYTIEDNNNITLSNPTRTGYDFTGWSGTEISGTSTNVIIPKGSTGDRSYTANWKAKEYSITLKDYNGNQTKNFKVSYDETLNKVQVPTRKGYTFLGYYDGNTKYYNSTGSFKSTKYNETKDLVLQEKWEKDTYSITYTLNGGSATNNATYQVDTATFKLNNPTREGYKFVGWIGTGISEPSKEVYVAVGSTGNKEYKAVWEYTITFTFDKNTSKQPVTTEAKVQTYGDMPIIDVPSADYYAFNGYFLNSKQYYNNDGTPKIKTVDFNENITLTASYTPITYKITIKNFRTDKLMIFVPDKVIEYTVEDNKFNLPASHEEIYTAGVGNQQFIGYVINDSDIPNKTIEIDTKNPKNITYNAMYSNVYNVSIDTSTVKDGWIVSYPTTAAARSKFDVSITAPQDDDGYEFKKWSWDFTDAEKTIFGFGDAEDESTYFYMPGRDVTLKVEYNPKTYNITYNLNGGTNNSSNPSTYKFGTGVASFGSPTKTGYAFAGWYSDSNFTSGNEVTAIGTDVHKDITLYAKWTVNSYTVKFNKNLTEGTGNNPGDIKDVSYDQNFNLPSNPYTGVEHYDFAGWNTQADGNGTTYLAGASVKNLTGSGEITLYAKWTPKTYSINYELNGGTNNSNNTSTYTYGVGLTLSDPTKTGYDFKGWYNNAGFTGNKITSISNTNSGDVNLYAEWDGETHSVFLHSTTLDVNPKKITAKYGDAMPTVGKNDLPTLSGRVFMGYYTQATGGTKYINADGTSARNFDKTEATHLYGHWANEEYNIIYVLDGGTNNSSNPSKYEYGTAVTLANPSKTGYTFDKWVDINGDKVTSISATSTGVKILYAKWNANKYTVAFEKGKTNAEGTMSSQELTYDSEERLSANAFTYKEGTRNYQFVKWSGPDGKDYSDKQLVKNLTAESGATITLTAQWTEVYTISYDLKNGTIGDGTNPSTYTELSDKIVLASPTRKGYTFKGWKNEGAEDNTAVKNLTIENGTTGDKKYVAVWEANTYTVTLMSSLISKFYTIEVTYDSEVIKLSSMPTKTGYHSTGFYEHVDGNGDRYFDGSGEFILSSKWRVASDVTLYSNWSENYYYVNYDANCDLYTGTMSKQEFRYATLEELNDNTFSRTGYDFIGWSTTKDGDVEYVDECPVMELTSTNYGEITLYAKWIRRYQVNYHLNGGTNDIRNLDSFVEGSSITLYEPTKVGYSFGGWFLDNDFTATKKVTSLDSTSNNGNNIDVYALFTVNSYPITLVDSITELQINQFNVKYGNKLSETVNVPKKEGYTFKGYYSDLISENNQYYDADGNRTYNDNWNYVTGKVLYAHWAKNNYKLYLNNTLGTGGISEINATYNEDLRDLKSTEIPTRTGYSFGGYYDLIDGMGNRFYDDEGKSVVKPWKYTTFKTAYAYWEPLEYKIVFHKNDETEATSEQTGIKYDELVSLNENTFSRTGYDFVGWAESSTGSKVYDDKELVKNLKDGSEGNTVKDLYAVWTEASYDIVYNLNGGTNSNSNPSTYKFGTGVASFKDASKTGYTFNGWYSDSNYINKVTNIANDKTGTVTLYAKFTANEYDVTLDQNHSVYKAADVKTITVTYDSAIATVTPLERTGYEFKGYFSSKVGGTKYINADGTSAHNYDIAIDTTFYAHWEQKKYTITYHYNNGSHVLNPTFYYYETGVSSFIPSERTGYTFLGWYDQDGDGGNKITSIDDYSNSPKDYDLYAHWKANEYNVILDYGNNKEFNITATYDQPMTEISEEKYTRKGYIFEGYGTYLETLILDKKYYELDASGKAVSANNWDKAVNNVKLHAFWKPITYTVKYDINYDCKTEYKKMTDSVYTYDNEYRLPKCTYTRDGYKFVGWSDVAPNTTNEQQVIIPQTKAYEDKDKVKNLADTQDKVVTLYAVWEGNPYLIQYEKNDSSATGEMEDQNRNVGDGKTLSELGYSKAGYHLVSWNTQADGKGEKYTPDDTRDLTLAENQLVYLYAQWRPNAAQVVDGVSYTQYKSSDPQLKGDYEEYTIRLGTKIKYSVDFYTEEVSSNYHNQTMNAYLVGTNTPIEDVEFIINNDYTITVKVPAEAVTDSIEFRINIKAKDKDKDEKAGDIGLTDNSKSEKIDDEKVNEIVEKYTDTDIKEEEIKEIINEINENTNKAKVDNVADHFSNEKLIEIATTEENGDWYLGPAENHDENKVVEKESENLVVVINVDITYDLEFKKVDEVTTVKEITFALDPYAVVYSNGQLVHKEVDGVMTDKFDVNNNDLGAGSGAKFLVTLPTNGIVPVELVHRSSDPNYSTPEYYYLGNKDNAGCFEYDEVNQTVSLYVSHFSTITINDCITKVVSSSTPNVSKVEYEAVYTWSKDYGSCTARYYVKDTDAVVIEETSPSYITVDNAKGYITYTANFDEEVFETQYVTIKIDGTNYPSLEFKQGQSEINGEVELREGGIYSYIKLVVNDINLSVDKEKVDTLVKDVKDIYPFELHLEDGKGNKVESKEGNKYGIKLVIPSSISGADNYHLVKINDDNTITLVDTTYDSKTNSISFVAEELGNYAIISSSVTEEVVAPIIQDNDSHNIVHIVGIVSLIALVILAVIVYIKKNKILNIITITLSLLVSVYLVVNARCTNCYILLAGSVAMAIFVIALSIKRK